MSVLDTCHSSIYTYFVYSIVAARYGDLSLDFVNLRTENYVENSRIPAMALGTPEEDAYRRDLTINALFYNIHTKQVEDFTKQGLADLNQRIIRTPLPALVTLTDDPLRTLRAVRFACRFNFTIASDLLAAGSSALVHSSLVNKVSVERIWNEIKMMLVKFQSYPRAVALLYTLGLLPHFLRVPPTELFIFNGTTLESIEQVQAGKMYHIAAVSVMMAKYVQKRVSNFPLLDKVFAKVFDKADVQRNSM
ncbi:CCA tRNA nucleotidyltransferase [archaeon]|nr:MAG: CCA tRNA nucleotidyltransferase [archaeon]